MSNKTKSNLSSIFAMAWQLVKRYGFTFSEALSKSWAIAKLRSEMHTRIVKFYFEKVDGTIREAFGTLKEDLLPPPNPERSHASRTIPSSPIMTPRRNPSAASRLLTLSELHHENLLLLPDVHQRLAIM